MIKSKKLFITGGAGFIANTLISKLIENNNIIAFDNFHRDTLSSSPYSNHPNLKVIKGDVLDYNQVLSTIKGANVIIHAVAIAGIDTVIKQPT